MSEVIWQHTPGIVHIILKISSIISDRGISYDIWPLWSNSFITATATNTWAVINCWATCIQMRVLCPEECDECCCEYASGIRLRALFVYLDKLYPARTSGFSLIEWVRIEMVERKRLLHIRRSPACGMLMRYCGTSRGVTDLLTRHSAVSVSPDALCSSA